MAAVAVAIAGRGGGGETTPGGTPATESIMDVHGLGINPADEALYIATHAGLFRAAPRESSATRVDAPEQDLMGFSIAGPDRFVASGRPGPDMDAPGNLGMIESTDRGRTWKTLSLSGEADLHLLRASGDAAYAYDGTLRASTDGGRTWEERGAPEELIDIAIDPADGEHVLASTGGGVRASSDGGRTWRQTALAAPALLAWPDGAGPFAFHAAGRILRSRDGGAKWEAGGSYQGQRPPSPRMRRARSTSPSATGRSTPRSTPGARGSRAVATEALADGARRGAGRGGAERLRPVHRARHQFDRGRDGADPPRRQRWKVPCTGPSTASSATAAAVRSMISRWTRSPATSSAGSAPIRRSGTPCRSTMSRGRCSPPSWSCATSSAAAAWSTPRASTPSCRGRCCGGCARCRTRADDWQRHVRDGATST